MLALQNSVGSIETWTVLPQWKILIWERHPVVLRAWEDGTGPREVAVVYTVLKGGDWLPPFLLV